MEDAATEVMDYLLRAEEAMLKSIADPTQLRGDGFVNYSQLNERLELAHEIGGLRKRAQNIIGNKRPIKTFNTTIENIQNDVKRKAVNDGPSATLRLESDCAFFVEGDTLYKYARGMRGDGNVYRRAVPLDYVYRICEATASILGRHDYATVQEIQKASSVAPPYRIQVTLGALVESHVLRVVGRGRYVLEAPKSLDLGTWIEELRALPRKQEWARAYKERGEA